MSSKLDQSLDTIMNEAGTARAGRRGRGRGRRGAARAAPVGGVRKSTRVASTATTTKSTSNAPSKTGAAAPATTGSNKVIVSNLPHDVPEADIKEFFTKVAGPIRRVMLTYGPNGQSRGVATIIFAKPGSGAKALEQNGTVVDKKTLRVEAVMDANATTSTAKTLTERVTAPNAQPKKATAGKATEKATGTAARGGASGARGRGRAPRGGRNARPKKKTAAELDAEMTDYFGGNGDSTAAAAPAAANGPAAPAAGADDLGMDDIS